MAKITCTCGEFIQDDNPQQSPLTPRRADFDVDADPSLLFGKATSCRFPQPRRGSITPL